MKASVSGFSQQHLQTLWTVAALGCAECSRVPIPKRIAIKLWLFPTLLFFLAGCTVGPNYHRPNVPAAPAWKEQAPWRASDPKDALPKGSWWTIFGDPELDNYETQALAANQTIEIARNQLEQARASARITQSGWFPQASTGLTAQRSLISGNRPANGAAVAPVAATQNNFTLPFNFSWEADVFGRVRRSVESANALYQASAAQLENVRLVITSELAVDYFTLRELDAEIAVVDSAVEYQQRGLRLVQNRHEGGIASGLERVDHVAYGSHGLDEAPESAEQS